MKKATKLKLGDWLLDVAKYTLTVGIITTFLGLVEQTAVLYLFSAVVFLVCLIVGVWFIDKNG